MCFREIKLYKMFFKTEPHVNFTRGHKILPSYAGINEVKSYSSGMDYKCTLHVIIQVHSHNRYLFMHHACINSLCSYTPHAFTLVLLELVATQCYAFFMQTTTFNKYMYKPACL